MYQDWNPLCFVVDRIHVRCCPKLADLQHIENRILAVLVGALAIYYRPRCHPHAMMSSFLAGHCIRRSFPL